MHQKYRDTKTVNQIVDRLCEKDSYQKVYYRNSHEMPMPSLEVIGDIMALLKTVIFPGYYGNPDMNPDTMKYYIGANVERIVFLLSEQIKRGFCYECDNDKCFLDCDKRAQVKTSKFITQIPEIRAMLATDVSAAYDGDPATELKGEIIYSYPGITALLYHRVAHELHKLDIPLIPRIISEMAHQSTGIDIHPKAQIGKYFFIDHGTGTVIGATAIIGENVRIYQNVTLGAKSFPKDENGNPIKGIPRHPILEDNVIVYSGASILGRVRIGHHAVIGANVWLMNDVEPYKKVLKSQTSKEFFENGAGI